jgi:hypothetical protein
MPSGPAADLILVLDILVLISLSVMYVKTSSVSRGGGNPSEGAAPSACDSKVFGTAFRCHRAGVVFGRPPTNVHLPSHVEPIVLDFF